MKRVLVFIVVVLWVLMLTTTEAIAQNRMNGQSPGCRGGCCGGGGCPECCQSASRGYAPGRQDAPAIPGVPRRQSERAEAKGSMPVGIETVSGEVIDVYPVTTKQEKGLHLLLRTEDQTIDIHLGPARYLDAKDFRVERGSVLAVKGDRIPTDGLPAMVAFEVKQGDRTLILRDETGAPLWRGAPALQPSI